MTFSKTYFSLQPFKCPLVMICTTSLSFSNSTFCPHNVFMCSVCISEQTTIISLYNINWLVCVTETECVYCAVRTAYLYIIRVNFVVINLNNWRLIVLRSDNRSRHVKIWGQSTGHNPLLLLLMMMMMLMIFIIIIIIIIITIFSLLLCIGARYGTSCTEEQRQFVRFIIRFTSNTARETTFCFFVSSVSLVRKCEDSAFSSPIAPRDLSLCSVCGTHASSTQMFSLSGSGLSYALTVRG
jgi:hypothetical protein